MDEFLVEMAPPGGFTSPSPWKIRNDYVLTAQMNALTRGSYLNGVINQMEGNSAVSGTICRILRQQKLHMLSLLKIDPHAAVRQFLEIEGQETRGIHVVRSGTYLLFPFAD